jgi:hypothetical protein
MQRFQQGDIMQQEQFESVTEQALESVSGGFLGDILGTLTGSLGGLGGLGGGGSDRTGGLGGLGGGVGADLLGELLGVLPIPL